MMQRAARLRWARRRVAECRAELDRLDRERVPGADWRRVRAKAQAQERTRAELYRAESVIRSLTPVEPVDLPF